MDARTCLAIALISAASNAACAAQAAPDPQAAEPAPPPPSGAEVPPAEWEPVELAQVPAVVSLYDAPGWRTGQSGSFTRLEHPASRSTLSLRVSRAARLVRPRECDVDARLAWPSLPRPDPERIFERRALSAPEGFHGELVLGVEPASSGSTRGFAVAIGAAIGRCYVLVFETIAEGVDAARVVVERLDAVAGRLVPSVRLRGIDERVTPERAIR